MSIKVDITKLLLEQYKLDKAIQDNHKVTYKETKEKRLVALLVELGEFANTTRCFKFWSNKGRDEKERILDEAADCLHFYLSLWICETNEACVLTPGKTEVEMVLKKEDFVADNDYITDLFYKAFNQASSKQLARSLETFLRIIDGLGYSWIDLEEAYYKKLGVNYDRQNNNY